MALKGTTVGTELAVQKRTGKYDDIIQCIGRHEKEIGSLKIEIGRHQKGSKTKVATELAQPVC